jgi:hypothetical protein
MSSTLIFWPAFAQVIVTMAVMVAMGQARSASVRARKQSINDIAMNRPEDWDEQATKTANNFKNQFEMPVLFFAAIGFALAFRLVDPVLVGLAWLFVIARAVQTYIHIGDNQVPPRAIAYLVGVAAMLAMWIILAVRIGSA